MFNFSKKLFSTIFLILISTNLFSGLLPGTEVLVGTGEYKKIENLKVGDQLLVYNIPRKRIERSCKIHEIKKRKIKKIFLIETDSELFVFGLKQKVYNRRIKKFIPAKKFNIGDKLFSPEKGNLEIRQVFIDDIPNAIDSYEISIEDGNLFLIKSENGTNVLVHNHPIVFVFPVISILEKVVEVAVVATAMAAVDAIDHHFRSKKKSKNKGRKDNPELDDIVRDSDSVDKRKGKSKVRKKKGGTRQKNDDFDKTNTVEPIFVHTDKGTIRIGKTRNGETIVDRNFSGESSGNKPTLEFQFDKNDKLKIRYDE